MMNITVYPSKARGSVIAPPSKSMAHRLLICGGLAAGESIIHGLSYSEDVLATLDCLEALGARYKLDGDTASIHGADPRRANGKATLHCRECGSTLRFMIPICMTGTVPFRLDGSETLLNRPLSVFADIAEKQNLLFQKENGALTVCGPLTSGNYSVAGNISSQFISGLLFALPLLAEDSHISILPPFESRPYVDMTLAAMRTFGIAVTAEGDRFFVPGGSTYTPTETTVEGDFSNAAFLEALNLVGGDVTVAGLSEQSLQGDRVYRDYFETLKTGFCSLDIADCPDLGPILFVAASLLHGARFTGTRRLRIKESDRALCMAEELAKCGVRVEVEENSVTVRPDVLHAPDCPLCGRNDHRIVMSLSVLLTKLGGTITGAEAVRKSFPDFFEKFRALGIRVEESTLS